MSDQARLELENAFELYKQRASAETGKELALKAALYFGEFPHDRARHGPLLATLVTLAERKHLPEKKLRHRLAYRILIWTLGKAMGAPVPPRRPGWNDYYMARWQLTHEQRWADEIHRRTHYNDPNMVGWTANWMASSQRQQDPEFDRALTIAESKCGEYRCIRENHG